MNSLGLLNPSFRNNSFIELKGLTVLYCGRNQEVVLRRRKIEKLNVDFLNVSGSEPPVPRLKKPPPRIFFEQKTDEFCIPQRR